MTTAPRKDGQWAAVFVWGIWFASTVAAHVFVARYASRIPFRDDFGLVPYLEGSAGLADYWSQHNEHRIPLPRVLMVGLLRVWRDLRVLMFAEVWLLAAIAAAMMIVARRVRGRASYFDAFFPLAFLSWGNAANLLMGHQLSLILPSVITCTILLVIAAGPRTPRAKPMAAIGALLVSLPLNGGPGVTQAPVLALWCVIAAVAAHRSALRTGEPDARRATWIAGGAALATLALVGLYFVGFTNKNAGEYEAHPGRVLMQAVKFLTLSFGPAGKTYWPYSGVALAALCAGTLWLFVRVVRREPAERLRALGLAAVALGILAMAVTAGIARGSPPMVAFANRYVTLPLPLLCVIWFFWLRYGPLPARRFVQASLYSIALALLFFNLEFGTRLGQERRDAEKFFLHDLQSGMPVARMAEKHWRTFGVRRDSLQTNLQRLLYLSMEPLVFHPPDRVVFGPLKTLPRGVVSEIPSEACRVGRMETVLTHPECEIFYQLPRDARRVSGQFAIYPRSYRLGNTLGARFSVELVLPDGTPRVLWERTLRPSEKPEDRGILRFETAIPQGTGAPDLVLHTSFAPDQGDPLAWACWRSVTIE